VLIRGERLRGRSRRLGRGVNEWGHSGREMEGMDAQAVCQRITHITHIT
jgi:hypothetical protein